MLAVEEKLMKKMINLAFIYSIVALLLGVFYREFTKCNGFEGVTTLGKAHGHLLALGTIFFLIIGLYADKLDLFNKGYSKALITYNVGLICMVTMLVVRGSLQVLNTPLSSGMNASIAGIAGLGHIILAIGLIWQLSTIKKFAK